MKKILLIENRPDAGIGGVENYNKKILEIIQKNFKNVKIDKCALLDSRTIINKDQNIEMTKFTSLITRNKFIFLLCFGFHVFSFRKLVYKMNKKNNYDLIIDSTITYFQKLAKNDKYLWVQHVTPEFYSFQHIKSTFLRFFINLFFKIFKIKNPILNNKNIITFDDLNMQYIKNVNKESNLYPINLSAQLYDWEEVKKTFSIRQNKIVYFGRISKEQKNIDMLISLNKTLNMKIDFYGPGDNKLINKLGESYKGILNKDNLFNTISKYKYSILLSEYEGFPFSAVQSLSFGVPIILLNTFVSAQYLTNQNKNGLLLASNASVSEISELINQQFTISDEKYNEIAQNSYNFFKENLGDNLFKKKWFQLFKKYI